MHQVQYASKAGICRILKCHSHSRISIKFSILCENRKPRPPPAVYLCPKSKLDASGVLSSAAGPFLEPLRIVYPPQGWMAAGSCAVVWFLLHRHNTCT